MSSDSESTEGVLALIKEYSAEFDEQCLNRHTTGQAKYGQFSFLGKDMIEETLAEIVDMANYARYQFIKLRLLQLAMSNDPALRDFADQVDRAEKLGKDAFKGAGS